jgi:hypothetical protein
LLTNSFSIFGDDLASWLLLQCETREVGSIHDWYRITFSVKPKNRLEKSKEKNLISTKTREKLDGRITIEVF